MRRGECIAVLVIAACILVVPARARADGVLMRATSLPEGQRAALSQGIDQARRTHPEAFARVRTLRGHLPSRYRMTRGQEPSVVDELRSLGPGAAWALLDAIAGQGIERGAATDREWAALSEGLVHALAELRAQQAAPVFEHLFATGTDESTLRGAAIALGLLAGPRQRAILINALRADAPRRHAALWGLRHARHPDTASAVAALLGSATDEETSRLAARAMGYIGSSWAWKTGRAGEAKHEEPVRKLCSDALLAAHERYEGRVREQVVRSLSMVRHPSALVAIEERLARVARDDDRRALLALRRRLSMGSKEP